MRFACNDIGERIKPSYSGQKAKCPLCGGTIIGKCGKIYVWHWQHHQNKDCDSWKEHETEWHRKWKAKFPDDWQEVIIDNNGVKHIADIKIPNGVVIEFQNSSISSSTISTREEFYKNMVWVVNAKPFKNNISIRSLVNSYLRKIEENDSRQFVSIYDFYKEDLDNIEKNLQKNQIESNRISQIIKDKSASFNRFHNILANHSSFTNSIIEEWIHNKSYLDYETYKITKRIDPELKEQLYSISSEINKTESDINSWLQNMEEINAFESYKIGNKEFKIVPYTKIPATSFERARAVSKSSKNTLFPQITEFKTESEFKYFLHKKDQFDFAVDPTNAIDSFRNKIEEGKLSIESLEKALTILKEMVTDKLIDALKNIIKEIDADIKILNGDFDELETRKIRLCERQEKLLALQKKDIIEAHIEIEKVKNEDRTRVMRENKGLYSYYWQHERKSWKTANKTIYFDFGETYLFMLVKDGLFKKINKEAFIQNFLNPNPKS